MGKIARVLASSSLLVVLSTGVAAADASITNTGAGSTNSITNNNTKTSKVVCINNTLVSNSSSQTSNSGSASSTENTSAGSATTGNSSNTNVTNVQANGSCPTGTTPAPAGSPAATAAAGGKGGLVFDSKGNLVAGSKLPATGTADTVKDVAYVTAGVATVAAVSQIGLGAYRRRAFNS